MRRTATKFCSNSAVAVVKAEATRGSATCAYDTSHLVQLYPNSQHAPTAILHSSSAATRSCSSGRSSHALLSRQQIARDEDPSLEAESSLTLSYALKTRVWETLIRNTISLILGFLRKLGDA